MHNLVEMNDDEFWKLPDSARRNRLKEYVTHCFADPEGNPVKMNLGFDVVPEKVEVEHQPGGDDFDDYYVSVVFPALPADQTKVLVKKANFEKVSYTSDVYSFADEYGYTPYNEARLTYAKMVKGQVVYNYAFQSTGRSVDSYDDYPGRD